ncbi:MAG: hypothetical protein E7319_09875 [Clostridiales bacterium]|nr:hypothetical protein [Clostridiales bacterium]
MPLVNYCKKCKTEVPLGESCVYCGGKLPKTGQQLSFGCTHVPLKDWFCWNQLLRVGLPALLLVMAVSLIAEAAAGGSAAVERMLKQGFLSTMLILLGVMLLAVLLLLLMQGGERIHYVLDKQGVHAWVYLEQENPLQLYARFLTRESVEKLVSDDHALPNLVLIRHQQVSWDKIGRVRLWREASVLLLYSPAFWQAMHVNCPVQEFAAVEEMVRSKLKRRKEVKIQQ